MTYFFDLTWLVAATILAPVTFFLGFRETRSSVSTPSRIWTSLFIIFSVFSAILLSHRIFNAAVLLHSSPYDSEHGIYFWTLLSCHPLQNPCLFTSPGISILTAVPASIIFSILIPANMVFWRRAAILFASAAIPFGGGIHTLFIAITVMVESLTR